MSDRLFVYGTLLFEPVWLHLIGRMPRLERGTIHGWSRKAIKGATYPAICKEEGASVEGAVVYELSAAEWRAVDSYEDVGYIKAEVEVFIEHSSEYALTYARPEHSCSDLVGEWTVEGYLASGALKRFL